MKEVEKDLYAIDNVSKILFERTIIQVSNEYAKKAWSLTW